MPEQAPQPGQPGVGSCLIWRSRVIYTDLALCPSPMVIGLLSPGNYQCLTLWLPRRSRDCLEAVLFPSSGFWPPPHRAALPNALRCPHNVLVNTKHLSQPNANGSLGIQFASVVLIDLIVDCLKGIHYLAFVLTALSLSYGVFPSALIKNLVMSHPLWANHPRKHFAVTLSW